MIRKKMNSVRIPKVATRELDMSPFPWFGLSVEERLDSKRIEFRIAGYMELAGITKSILLEQILRDFGEVMLEEPTILGQEAALKGIMQWASLALVSDRVRDMHFLEMVLGKYCPIAHVRIHALTMKLFEILKARLSEGVLSDFLSRLLHSHIYPLLKDGKVHRSGMTKVVPRSKIVNSLFRMLSTLPRGIRTPLSVSDAVSVINSTIVDKQLRESAISYLASVCRIGFEVSQLGLSESRLIELQNILQSPAEPSKVPVSDSVSIDPPIAKMWTPEFLVGIQSSCWTDRCVAFEALIAAMESAAPIPPPSHDFRNEFLRVLRSEQNVAVLLVCCKLLTAMAPRLTCRLPSSELFLTFSFARLRDKPSSVRSSIITLIESLVTHCSIQIDAKFLRQSEITCVPRTDLFHVLELFIKFIRDEDRFEITQRIVCPILDHIDISVRTAAVELVCAILEDPNSSVCTRDKIIREIQVCMQTMSSARRKKIAQSILLDNIENQEPTELVP
jgi:hypothetical protein